MAPQVNKSRYSIHSLQRTVMILCNDCPPDEHGCKPSVWTGDNKPFSHAFLAVIRHSRRVHKSE